MTLVKDGEKNQRINKLIFIKNLLANEAGKHLSYQSWTADFCQESLKDLHQDIIEQMGRVSLMNLEPWEATRLGFGRWDEADSLQLIPIWLYPFLCPGDALESIGGGKVVVGESYTDREKDGYIDNDSRFGFLAYGVRV